MRKQHLYIIGMVALCLALLGWWGYDRYFHPDTEIQAQLNDQFGTEFFHSDAGQTTVGDEPITATVLERIKEQQAIRVNAAPANANTPTPPVMEEAIMEKYAPHFQALENLASSRLDTLYSAALKEYRQQQAAGNVNMDELARKYIQAGTMVEANIDGQFYSTLNTMQTELVQNNQSTAIIADIKNEHDAAKSQNRAELLAKARH